MCQLLSLNRQFVCRLRGMLHIVQAAKSFSIVVCMCFFLASPHFVSYTFPLAYCNWLAVCCEWHKWCPPVPGVVVHCSCTGIEAPGGNAGPAIVTHCCWAQVCIVVAVGSNGCLLASERHLTFWHPSTLSHELSPWQRLVWDGCSFWCVGLCDFFQCWFSCLPHALTPPGVVPREIPLYP